MTKSGVETDLPHSPYKLFKEDITFYFSCARYMEKFNTAIPDTIEAVKMNLNHRYGVQFNGLDKLAMLMLYWKTEKRGFYIEIKDEPIERLSDISLNVEQCTLCRKIKEVIESG